MISWQLSGWILSREVELVSKWTVQPGGELQSALSGPTNWKLCYIKHTFTCTFYMHQPFVSYFMVSPTEGSESQCVGRIPTTARVAWHTCRHAATQKQTAETTTPPTTERCRCHAAHRAQWRHHAAVANTTAGVRHDVADDDVADVVVANADVADATFGDSDWSKAAGWWRTPGFSRAADCGKLWRQILSISQCFVMSGILSSI